MEAAREKVRYNWIKYVATDKLKERPDIPRRFKKGRVGVCLDHRTHYNRTTGRYEITKGSYLVRRTPGGHKDSLWETFLEGDPWKWVEEFKLPPLEDYG